MKTSKTLLAAVVLAASATALASGDHAAGQGHMPGMGQGMMGGGMPGMHRHMMGGGMSGMNPSMMGGDHAEAPGGAAGHTHQHDKWVAPPRPYAGKTWSHWDDKAIAARGERLFMQNCVVCHGSSGRGDGPMAARLGHRPADLTHHFHTAPGKGDDYLFWRISEGGAVPPFNAMQSAMPSFKHLGEDDRWAILTFVHQRFHGGFKGEDHDADGHEHEDGASGHAH